MVAPAKRKEENRTAIATWRCLLHSKKQAGEEGAGIQPGVAGLTSQAAKLELILWMGFCRGGHGEGNIGELLPLQRSLRPHLPSPVRWPNMPLIWQKTVSLVLSILLCPPARYKVYIKHRGLMCSSSSLTLQPVLISVTGELKETLGRLTLLTDTKPFFPNTVFYILYPEFSCVHYFLLLTYFTKGDFT